MGFVLNCKTGKTKNKRRKLSWQEQKKQFYQNLKPASQMGGGTGITKKAPPATIDGRNRILVITDNGKLPKDGGKRLAYQVGNCLIPVGQFGVIYLNQKSEPKPEPESPKPKNKGTSGMIIYRRLPTVYNSDGKCRECGHSPNFSQLLMTDEGWQRIIICSNCGLEMKPFIASSHW